MAEALTALMDGRSAATISRGANGLLRLEYRSDHAGGSSPTPISLSMPLAQPVHSDTRATPRVTNFLQGLLPDDLEILRAWARRYQSSTSPFNLLGTPAGRDCAGGVAFCPEPDVDGFLARGGTVEWLTDDDVATALRQLRRDPAAAVLRNFTGQFSLAGAQAKIALRHDADGKRWGRPTGTEPTTHILKPSAAGWRDQDLNEHLCLAAAARAGLDVARSEIRRFGDETAIVVARYDRVVDGTSVTRIHQEDLCQAFGLAPDHKYENQGGPSAGAIAKFLRRVMPAQDAERAITAFADGLIWNWLVMGTDAHAKNYSLLLRGTAVRLAPLYDISSMLPYLGTRHPSSKDIINARDMTYAMKLGGQYVVRPLRNRWPSVARELGISPDALVTRARTLAAGASDAFTAAASDPIIAAERSSVVAHLVEQASARAAECLRVLEDDAAAKSAMA